MMAFKKTESWAGRVVEVHDKAGPEMHWCYFPTCLKMSRRLVDAGLSSTSLICGATATTLGTVKYSRRCDVSFCLVRKWFIIRNSWSTLSSLRASVRLASFTTRYGYTWKRFRIRFNLIFWHLPWFTIRHWQRYQVLQFGNMDSKIFTIQFTIWFKHNVKHH